MSRKSKLLLPVPNPRTIRFGYALRELRRAHGIQAYKVAEQLGWDNSLQTRMEQGKTYIPDPSVVDSMAQVMGLSENEIDRLRLSAEYIPTSRKELYILHLELTLIREKLQDALSLVNELEASQSPHLRERE